MSGKLNLVRSRRSKIILINLCSTWVCLIDWLINPFVFYAVSAVFQSYNGLGWMWQFTVKIQNAYHIRFQVSQITICRVVIPVLNCAQIRLYSIIQNVLFELSYKEALQNIFSCSSYDCIIAWYDLHACWNIMTMYHFALSEFDVNIADYFEYFLSILQLAKFGIRYWEW